MKRLWIGIGLLSVMLLAGILTPMLLQRSHTPVRQDLQRAAELAMAENWDTATQFSRRAEQKWQKTRPVTAAFTEHEPMDEIDALFARLRIYAKVRDSVAYSSTCAYLASQLDALGDYHDLNLWNLL